MSFATMLSSAAPATAAPFRQHAKRRQTHPEPSILRGRFVEPDRDSTVRASIASSRTLADWIGFASLMGFSLIVLFVNLTASGYANEFYSAAAQAGSVDWWAFLWGSSDAGNSITVDKPPAAIWLMALSVRIFGLSSFAILLPEALCGLISIGLVYAGVRRYWGNWAGIIAGFALATTPVAALMFRFNNPDALLVALMTGATYAVLRSLEYPDERHASRRRTAWMALAGMLIGFGFLTKQMQVFLVLPGFAAAFLIASPTKILRRIVDGLIAVASMIVAAGWWVLLTVIVPSGSRPYIGGSQTDSFLELTFSYNGFGRLTGNETGAVVGGGGGGNASGGMWGQTGITRLFDGEYGGQIAWLAIVAAAGIIVGLIVSRRSARTDLRRASIIAWGGWLIVTWLTFSYMAGIFHQYYTVALAPAIAALTGIAVSALWQKRHTSWARFVAAAVVYASTIWSATLIARSTWLPQLRGLVLLLGTLAAIALAALAIAALPLRVTRRMRTAAAAETQRIIGILAIACSAIALVAGPAAWTAYTISTGHTGSIVTAGPNVTNSTGMGGGPGGMGGGPGQNGGPGGGMGGPINGSTDGNGTDGNGNADGSSNSDGSASSNAMPGQTDGQSNGQSDGQTDGQSQSEGRSGGPGGGMGGLLGGGSASSEIVAMLQENADQYTWAAATTGSQNAASYQLASEEAVMPIGGFNGSDPSPTLEQFKQYVAEGRIHYYIGGGGMGGNQMGGSSAASEIAAWVAENFEAQTVDGVTIYDLTQN